MKTVWVLTLGLVSLAAVQGCKQKEPEPIPGPKAGMGMAPLTHTPGIAWFQGSFDEAFAQVEIPQHCKGQYSITAPRAPEMARARKHPNSSSVTPGICGSGSCPPFPRPRHRLV
jgi:hypothetical protein